MRQPGNNDASLVTVIVICALLVLGLIVCVPVMLREREARRRAESLERIKRIGLEMRQYSRDFQDVYPAMLDPHESEELHWSVLEDAFPEYGRAGHEFYPPSPDGADVDDEEPSAGQDQD